MGAAVVLQDSEPLLKDVREEGNFWGPLPGEYRSLHLYCGGNQSSGRVDRDYGGPSPQAHHGLLISFLYYVTPDFCVAIILGWLPLQSHTETPRISDPNILGRTWLVCGRQIWLDHHTTCPGDTSFQESLPLACHLLQGLWAGNWDSLDWSPGLFLSLSSAAQGQMSGLRGMP